jgi:hypothetical protein
VIVDETPAKKRVSMRSRPVDNRRLIGCGQPSKNDRTGQHDKPEASTTSSLPGADGDITAA